MMSGQHPWNFFHSWFSQLRSRPSWEQVRWVLTGAAKSPSSNLDRAVISGSSSVSLSCDPCVYVYPFTCVCLNMHVCLWVYLCVYLWCLYEYACVIIFNFFLTISYIYIMLRFLCHKYTQCIMLRFTPMSVAHPLLPAKLLVSFLLALRLLSCLLSQVCDPLNLIEVACIRMDIEWFTKGWAIYKWLHHWRKRLPCHSNPLSINCFLRRGKNSCGLIGVDVSLLVEVCHYTAGFEVSDAQPRVSLAVSPCCFQIQM